MFLPPFARSSFPWPSHPPRRPPLSNNQCVCWCVCVSVSWLHSGQSWDRHRGRRGGAQGESRPIHRHKDIINQIGEWFEKPPLEHCVLVIGHHGNFTFAAMFATECARARAQDDHVKSHKWLSAASSRDTHTAPFVQKGSGFLPLYRLSLSHENLQQGRIVRLPVKVTPPPVTPRPPPPNNPLLLNANTD